MFVFLLVVSFSFILYFSLILAFLFTVCKNMSLYSQQSASAYKIKPVSTKKERKLDVIAAQLQSMDVKRNHLF